MAYEGLDHSTYEGKNEIWRLWKAHNCFLKLAGLYNNNSTSVRGKSGSLYLQKYVAASYNCFIELNSGSWVIRL